MAKNDLFDFDPDTAGNNTDIAGTSIAEGCLPGNLNDALRSLASIAMRAIGDQGANIASATTTSIAAASTSLYAHITGTTTITGFGTVAAGTLRILVFDGALTLTHNATSLMLPGNANITTVAGDVAIMVSEGSGNWKCVAYIRDDGSPITVTSASIAADAVTYAKIQNVSAASRLLGRGSAAGAGDVEEISLGTGLSMSSTTLAVTSGTVIQQVVLASTTATSNAANIAIDSTIPQNTEGTELFLQAFTPKNASSTLVIEADVIASHGSTGVNLALALFVDATANAIAATGQGSLAADLNTVRLTYTVSAGSTSARTYAVRYGAESGTMYVNQTSGGATYGANRIVSMLKITELAP